MTNDALNKEDFFGHPKALFILFFTEKGISGTRNPKNTFALVKQKSPDIQRIF